MLYSSPIALLENLFPFPFSYQHYNTVLPRLLLHEFFIGENEHSDEDIHHNRLLSVHKRCNSILHYSGYQVTFRGLHVDYFA